MADVVWKALKNQADAAYKAQQYAKAAESYSKLLTDFNLNAADRNTIFGNRCLAYQKAGQWQPAVADAEETLKYDPTKIQSWYRYGISLLTAKLPHEASEALKIALEIDPGNADSKQKLKKAGQAMRAKAGKPAGPLETLEANSDLQQRVRKTLEAAKTARLDRPKHSPAMNGTDANRAGGESATDASGPETPSITSDPATTRSSEAGSSAPKEDEEMPQADDSAEKQNGALSPEDLANRHKLRGTEFYKNSNWKDACQAYSEAIELTPDNAVLYANRAAVRLMLGQFRPALEDSKAAIQKDPQFLRGYHRAAKAFLTMGKFNEAEEMFREALKIDEADAAAKEGLLLVARVVTHLNAGLKNIQDADPRQALWNADSAIRLSNPAVEQAVILRVKVLSDLGRHSEALTESRNLTFEGDPNSPEVLAVRAEITYAAGNLQMAERLFQQALRMDPDSSASRRGIKRLRSMTSAKEAGNEAFKQGRWEDAHGHYSKAVEADPKHKSTFIAQCYANRSAAALKLERNEEAVADADKAIEYDPDFVKAYLRRAAANNALQDFEAVVRDYEKVKSLAPETDGIEGFLQDAKTALKKSKRVDYYKILGVEPTASVDEIKRAYKKQALKLHPDKVPAEEREEAQKKFQQLTAGHTLLTDSDKRARYDAGWSDEEISNGFQEGMGGFGGGMGGGMGGGIDPEILAHLFGQAGGGMRFGGMGGSSGRQRGFSGFY